MFPVQSLIRSFNALTSIHRNAQQISGPVAFFASKTLNELAGLPPKPKKPLTPYFRFLQQARPQVKMQNPNMSATELIKIVAKQWEQADAATKSQLEQEYKRERERYDQENTRYLGTLTPEMKDQLRQARQDKQEMREKRELRKRNKDLQKPRRVPSAFLRFVIEEKARSPHQGNYQQYLKTVALKWGQLSEAQKKPYLEAYHSEMEGYKRELDKWEQKMIKAGNLDVVRNPIIDTSAKVPRRRKD